jgi:GTP pyrophosphokinase/guanosine-3',5'-bis(diphosphate) 3'-pyrophosphohydrolase
MSGEGPSEVKTKFYPPKEELIKELLKITDNHRLVKKAIEFADKKHSGQTRKSGEPYIVHPLAVALKLAQMKMDIPTVVAGILHDVLEDTDATEQEIKELFGEEILRLVCGVTKLDKHKFRSTDEAQAENFRKLLIATAQDPRVLIIKLVDRLDNIRSLSIFRREKQIRIARETLLVYAPLAHLLGMWDIKSQLEDISFKYLYPSEYEKVRSFVGKARKQLEEYLKKYILPPLKEILDKYQIKAEIKYRTKHLYSIWEKTKRKGIPLEEVHDILGVRIITDDVAQCYTALGLIHQLWRPVAGKFKDYISNPKPNLYQSLHTTVIGPKGRWVEFQIRTWDMHLIAEKGIAAHWAYKAGRKADISEQKLVSALRDLVERLQTADYEEIKEISQSLRHELEKQIFVYTPKGDVIALPKGATPVDFAYAIHTEIGNHCAGAKVNGRWVPLDYQLQTGERVEIITSPNKKPSPEWLKFVKTSKARQKIKHFLKKEIEKIHYQRGKEIWHRLEKKYQLNLEEFLSKIHKTEKEFFIQLGSGKLTEKWILGIIGRELKKEETCEKTPVGGILSSKELKGIAYRLAKCCYPLPGEEVKAVVSKGGLVIHSKDCPNLKNVEKVSPEKVLTIKWEDEGIYPVKLRILAKDRIGLAGDITLTFAKHGINIQNIHSASKGNYAIFDIVGLFKNTNQLKDFVKELKKIPEVEEIKRLINS